MHNKLENNINKIHRNRFNEIIYSSFNHPDEASIGSLIKILTSINLMIISHSHLKLSSSPLAMISAWYGRFWIFEGYFILRASGIVMG